MASLLRRANPIFPNSLFLHFSCSASSSATLASAPCSNKISVNSANKSCTDVVSPAKREVLSSPSPCFINADARKLITIVDAAVQELRDAYHQLGNLAEVRERTFYKRPKMSCFPDLHDRRDTDWSLFKEHRSKENAMINRRRVQLQQLAWMESVKEFLQN